MRGIYVLGTLDKSNKEIADFYLEQFGAVSVGNPYMFGLVGVWEDQPDGAWGPAKTPVEKGIEIKTRDQALRLIIEWNLRKPV